MSGLERIILIWILKCQWYSLMAKIMRKGKTTMNKEKALKKLQRAKQEALVNSTDIRVGRLELNEAMKALRTIIALQNILKDE